MKTDFVVNHIRHKHLNEKILVSTDFGTSISLTKEQFGQLKRNEVDNDLFDRLNEKGIVITEDNVDKITEYYEQFFDGSKSIHIIQPTIRNNLLNIRGQKATDSSNMRGYDMNSAIAKKTADFILQSPHEIVIRFQGGEPLLNFDVVKYVIDYTEKNKGPKQVTYELVTNLLLMDDKIAEYIDTHNIRIITYFDGHEATHNSNWQDFAIAESWIKKLKEVHCICTVSKPALEHSKEIVAGFVEAGVHSVKFALHLKGNNATTANEFLTFWKQASNYVKTTPALEEYPLERPLTLHFAYTRTGDIYFTNGWLQLFDIFRMGDVDQKFEEVMRSDELKATLNSILTGNPILEKSPYQPLFHIDPVETFGETGTIIPRFPNNRFLIFEGMMDWRAY